MSGLAWIGWAGAATVAVCAAVGLWHHRRDAARLARCVHELRGALGALRLGLDLALARGGLSPERLRALDLQLERATSALQEMSGSGSPAGRGTVPVAGLLTESVAALQPLAISRGAELRLADVSDSLVLGERGRLAQALGNLIANAIEHGGRKISVGARVGEGAVRLEVRDDGSGLRSLPELRGVRRSLRLATVADHGHGLSVVSDIAVAHGGRLLSAPAQRGAKLVLELPLACPDGLAVRAGSP